jgi:SH3-like domain-containing protein
MTILKIGHRWVIILLVLSGFCLAAPSGFAAAPKILSVQVRETQMRATPSFLGKITGRLAYGDAVNLLEEGRDWKKVAPAKGRVQGWVHASALTAKKIVMRAGKGTVQTGASGGEIALAGKGFSDEVEKEFRKKNRNLDFAWVNRMEAFRITPAEIEIFLRQGKVTPSEGGAP